MEPKYYVVFIGKKRGVFFDTWDNVETLTKGFSYGKAKRYKSEELARKAYGDYRGLHANIKKVRFFCNYRSIDFKNKTTARIAYGIYRGENTKIKKVDGKCKY